MDFSSLYSPFRLDFFSKFLIFNYYYYYYFMYTVYKTNYMHYLDK